MSHNVSSDNSSSEVDDLLPITAAAKEAGVARNTMLLAAKQGKIKAIQIGKPWFVYASDIDRWKTEHYRPDMAYRYPIKDSDDNNDTLVDNPTKT